MKNIKSILALFIVAAGVGFFSNCDDPVVDPPVTSELPILNIQTNFQGTTVQAWRAEEFNFAITAAENTTTKSQISKFEINIIAPGADWDTTITVGQSSFTYNYSYKVPTDVADGNTISITFSATDQKSKVKKITYTLNCVDPKDIIFWEGIELGAQSNASIGSSFSTTTGKSYLISEANAAQDEIDWVYLYDLKNSWTACFVSPSDGTMWGTNTASQYPNFGVHAWTVKNNTQFKQIVTGDITSDEFANLSAAQIAEHYTNNSQPARTAAFPLTDANGQPPSIYAFRTTEQKYGVFWVKQLDYTSTGKIVVDIKVQK